MSHRPGQRLIRIPLLLLLFFALIFLCGCTTTPRASAVSQAHEAGASWEEVSGKGFDHLVISRINTAEVHTLHIYIGGDGQAFQSRLKVSRDPTPKNPLTLKLMLADNSPSIFIARPCYFTASMGNRCNATLWTSARYSQQVVDSIATVIDKLSQRYPDAQITLVGYSGGGVIALLAALQLPQPSSVITIASPLDTLAWTQLHGYTSLRDSLNPTDISAWPAALSQTHFSGRADKNVPQSVTNKFRLNVEAQGIPANFKVIPNYDHRCCWLNFWSEYINSKN